jgi:hypothetical protein
MSNHPVLNPIPIFFTFLLMLNFPSGYPTEMYALLISPLRAIYSTCLIPINAITLTIFDEQYKF